ncbi:cytosolic carboxypeptidase 2 [Apus apus]|uniref:cytosolic carboxypeptidase 2 n=1 Tax=Apus apus TaxID=8895 RepID=UPI0021F8B218|nr:cytosolic carboxypeptidase 2 [Apus apus]
MQPSGDPSAPAGKGALGGHVGGLVHEPYDSFIRSHLRHYGYFRAPGVLEPAPLVRHGVFLGEPRALRALPSARGPLPAPHWPIECEVIKEHIEHIEWVPPEPEPFCQPTGPEQAPPTLGEETGTIVYHLHPAPAGSRFTRARVGGAPGPLSSPAAPLEGPQDTTLLFESRFESGNLQKAVKVGPYEYVLWLRPDLYTTRHTQWFYFRVQNTRRAPLYRFTIANLAKPTSLYTQGLRPLLYSQRDAQSRGIGWRRVGTDVRYYRGSGDPAAPASFRLSWTSQFPHDGDTCFFAHSYPYTYTDLRRYLRALAGDPSRSRFCAVRELCRSLAGNAVYLLTITSPAGGAGAKRGVVATARAHPGESGGSWAMRGFLDFLLGSHPDARLLRRLFVFTVVPMLNPDGVVVGNSRCSLAGRDPNRAYGTGLQRTFPGVWHLRDEVERVLAEREVVLYCDFHGHSRKNNVFMYGCDRAGAGPRLHQRLFPFMLSKNAPDKFCFSSCKFKVQKSKAGTGRVVMWRMGISNSYTLEVAFGGSTLGGRNSHFTTEDIKSLGYLLCDTLLDFCDPHPAKFQQCLSEVEALLWQRLRWDPGSGGSWSDVSPSELESSTSGSDSSVSDEPPGSPRGQEGRGGRGVRLQVPPALRCPPAPRAPRRRKRLRSRRARNVQRRSPPPQAGPGSPRPQQQPPAQPGASSSGALPGTAGAGAGRRVTAGRARRDGGTRSVPPLRPSTLRRGTAGDSSRDRAPGGSTSSSRQRSVQAAAARGARPPLPGPGRASAPAAPRCRACARDQSRPVPRRCRLLPAPGPGLPRPHGRAAGPAGPAGATGREVTVAATTPRAPSRPGPAGRGRASGPVAMATPQALSPRCVSPPRPLPR